MNSNPPQLNSAESFDVNKIIFSKPQDGSIPDSKPAINYKRVYISADYGDGKSGELIIPTELLFSFGLGINENKDTGKPNGYVMPLCLLDRNGATEKQLIFVDKFNKIVEHCKKHIIDNKEEYDQHELEMSDLKKFNPLYYKREKGKVVEGTGPTLYGKLITSKKNGIITKFYDMDSEESLNPMDLMATYCHAVAAIKFESIFIGNKISLQVKISEVNVRPTSTGNKRLLKRPDAETRVLSSIPINNKPNPYSLPLEEDSGSIVDDEEETKEETKEDQEKLKTPPKKIVKKVVKKVVKKKEDDE